MSRRHVLKEAQNLRLRMQINSRLRLEALAALSKVFREYGEPLGDELLSSLIFAVPEELIGEARSIGENQKSTSDYSLSAMSIPGEPTPPSTPPPHKPTTPSTIPTPVHKPTTPSSVPTG